MNVTKIKRPSISSRRKIDELLTFCGITIWRY
nr:MAG TPA: hypothetical protein [Caudoviricetes sp.]